MTAALSAIPQVDSVPSLTHGPSNTDNAPKSPLWKRFLFPNNKKASFIYEAAERIIQLMKDKKLRFRLGQKAKGTVAKRFLLTRYMEQYLDLFNSFETVYRLKKIS